MKKVIRFPMLVVASGLLVLAVAHFAYTPPPMRVILFASIVDRIGQHAGQMPLSKDDKDMLADDARLIKGAHETALGSVKLERDLYTAIGGILALLVLIQAIVDRRRPNRVAGGS